MATKLVRKISGLIGKYDPVMGSAMKYREAKKQYKAANESIADTKVKVAATQAAGKVIRASKKSGKSPARPKKK